MGNTMEAFKECVVPVNLAEVHRENFVKEFGPGVYDAPCRRCGYDKSRFPMPPNPKQAEAIFHQQLNQYPDHFRRPYPCPIRFVRRCSLRREPRPQPMDCLMFFFHGL
eukprot:GHVU01057392.1.p1 GENE.GHVU01057392.1~~GHVU01057392.1.p1  ORF type:complete len:108 (+),score=5.14 GHVU01057392.1:452-775(+)